MKDGRRWVRGIVPWGQSHCLPQEKRALNRGVLQSLPHRGGIDKPKAETTSPVGIRTARTANHAEVILCSKRVGGLLQGLPTPNLTALGCQRWRVERPRKAQAATWLQGEEVATMHQNREELFIVAGM